VILRSLLIVATPYYDMYHSTAQKQMHNVHIGTSQRLVPYGMQIDAVSLMKTDRSIHASVYVVFGKETVPHRSLFC